VVAVSILSETALSFTAPSSANAASVLYDPAVSAEKARLRAEALGRRDGLSEAARQAGSEAVGRHILALDLPAGAAISAFLPIRSELDLRPLIGRLQAAGHPIGLPVMRKPDLVFRRWLPRAALVPLGFGTYGPGPEAPELTPDIMLVPLAAFDRRGGRIGYGKAFYDTTIAGYHAAGHFPQLIGVAFSVQEVGEVPMEAHDQPLPVIVTEAEIVRRG